jgi:hypothetical protein
MLDRPQRIERRIEPVTNYSRGSPYGRKHSTELLIANLWNFMGEMPAPRHGKEWRFIGTKISRDMKRIATTLGYRRPPTAEDVREQTRERVRRYRERKAMDDA